MNNVTRFHANRAEELAELNQQLILDEGHSNPMSVAELAARMRANDIGFRLTLAEVYADAGLLKRARSELDVALRLDPRDARTLLDHL